jgi:hypothetical protein
MLWDELAERAENYIRLADERTAEKAQRDEQAHAREPRQGLAELLGSYRR